MNDGCLVLVLMAAMFWFGAIAGYFIGHDAGREAVAEAECGPLYTFDGHLPVCLEPK